MQINRTHHLDLDFVADSDEQITNFVEDLTIGLLVTWELVVNVMEGDGVNEERRGTVRFSGPKRRLEDVLDRFITHPDFDGDEALHLVDDRMADTLAGN